VILGNADSVAATGHARIYEADLGQLHLFGLLSRLLTLGTLHLNTAQSTIQVAHGYIRIPT